MKMHIFDILAKIEEKITNGYKVIETKEVELEKKYLGFSIQEKIDQNVDKLINKAIPAVDNIITAAKNKMKKEK
jgi:Ni,Fe-hydrogenase maturation factor